MYKEQESGGHAPLIREALNVGDDVSDRDIEDWEDPEDLFDYIDDFIGIDVDFIADLQWDRLKKLLVELGLNLSTTKGHLVPPSECFTALGIEFNIPLNLIRIPENKLTAGMELIKSWEGKQEATKTELQQLLGVLNHFSGCIKKGRLFVSRMLSDLRAAYCTSPHPVKLSDGFKKDLKWWKECMVDYNGYAILDHRETGSIISMDASKKGEVGGLAGIAAFNFDRQEYFHCPVPPWLQHLDVRILTASRGTPAN